MAEDKDDFSLADDYEEGTEEEETTDEEQADEGADDGDQGKEDEGKDEGKTKDDSDDEEEDDWKLPEGESKDNGEEEDDDDLTDAEKAAIDKRINKLTSPVNTELQQLRVKNSVNEFLDQGNNAEVFKGLKDKIVATAMHKSAKDWPIERIAYAVAGKRLLKEGARIGRQADEEAATTKHSGSPAKNTTSNGQKQKAAEKDYENMSDEDFDKELESMGVHI